MTNSILVDAKQGAALLGVSLRTYLNLAKEPGFPPARSLGPRCVRWVNAELEAYAVALPPVTRDEPAQFAAARAARAAGRPVQPAPFDGQL